MQEIGGGLMTIIWLALSLMCWILYHKIFGVLYFDLLNGLINEIIGSLIVGALLLLLLMKFWYIAVGIIGVSIYLGCSKKNNG